VRGVCLALALSQITFTALAQTQTAAFVAPPRTIADINALLDGARPNLAEIAAKKSLADSSVNSQLGQLDLAQFYYKRAIARWDLGRTREAISDCEEAIRVARAASRDPYDYQTLLLRLYSLTGVQWLMASVLQEMVQENSAPEKRWRLLAIYRHYSNYSLLMGRIDEAEMYLQRAEAIMAEAKAKHMPLGVTSNWVLEETRAKVFARRGNYTAAERSFHEAQEFNREAIRVQTAQLADYNLRNSQQFNADLLVVREAEMKLLQGRVIEAEADIRGALLNRLGTVGKYNSEIPVFIQGLANTIAMQGRFSEAETLTRTSLEIYQTIGITKESTRYLAISSALARILSLEQHWNEVARIFDEIDDVTKKWPQQLRDLYRLDVKYVYAFYETGRTLDGVALARELLRSQANRFGENHPETAKARGYLAIGLARANRNVEALREFRTAIPILVSRSGDDHDDESGPTLVGQARETIIEAHISLLARSRPVATETDVDESFKLADLMRGGIVQGALARSSARIVAGNEVLANLVRRQQDLGMQIGSSFGVLNNLLELPVADRDEKAVTDLRERISVLRAEREIVGQEIGKVFPAYADLLKPGLPSVDQIRELLRPEEAFVSFYFGHKASFVWAVPKDGPVSFAAVATTAEEIETRVRKLREALEPRASMISDIPPFDLALAYELYRLLLKPVEAGWKPARSLIIATNGALGFLPLSLLPTAPTEVVQGQEPAFAEYRTVPWLARSHAVTMVPSAAAFRTLRRLPAGSDRREQVIGFGDPIFSKEQADQHSQNEPDTPVQVVDTSTRGIPLKRRSNFQLEGVDSAELAQLPRLPDTAEELRSIAFALEADPSKVLKLGVTANERTVKTTDLSKYKIIVFATHGLVPGELNGLTQPALALSAPDVAGVDGDGLLTMDEILALKLDADWVVLSACNTATGAGAGAEAASGLGRAFFYAGTRAILVTNWSVHSASARALVSDLFRRQARAAKISRGEALREAMTALIDGPGYQDEQGNTLFTYAHPLFWAPYTIIGDSD
jgi:CHAT domain-containing protein